MRKKHSSDLSVRSIKFNAVMNTLLTASNMLVSVITIPYATRVLSVEGYGDVTFAQSLSTWLSSLCLVGIPTYGVRECARVRDDPKALARVVRELLIIISMFTAVVLAAFAVCIGVIPRLNALASLMWVFWISTLLLSYGVEWYFQAVEQYEYITIRSVIFKVLSLIAILTFVRRENDWFIYGAILALVVCGNNIFNIVRLLRTVSFHGLGPFQLQRHAKPLVSYAVLSIASAVYLAFDSVLLGILNTNNVQVALYQLAAKIKGICWQVINAVIGVLIPRLSYYISNDSDKYCGLLKRGFGFVLNLCLGIMFYVFIYAQPLVILISSEKYVAATVPVQIIGAVNFFSCMSYFIGLCILSPLGRESKFATANLLGVPISLALNIVFDGHLGAIGAAIAVLIAEIAIFCKQVWDARDILKTAVTFTSVFKIVISHTVAFVIAFGMSIFLSTVNTIDLLDTSGAATAIIAGFSTYCITWAAAAFLLRDDTAIWGMDTLKEIIRKVRG